MGDDRDRFNLASWLLDDNVAKRPQKVAVRSAARDLTYAQVADEAARVQELLRELGHLHEQRVLLVVPDVAEFVTSWLGILLAGGVFAMVNPRLSAEDYAYYLEYSRAPVAIVHADALEAFAQAARGARFLRAVITVGAGERDPAIGREVRAYERAIPATKPAAARFDSHAYDLCGWLFTSGTSGKPKAAQHFHRDFAWNVDRYAKQVLAMGERDVTMAVSKLFFGYATGTNLMFPFAVGATTALFAEPSKPEAIVANARRHRPTLLAAVPTTLHGILQLPEAEVGDAFASLRCVVSAGEALPPQLLSEFHRRFGVEILDGIGSAEMFHIYISNRPGDVTPGSLGRLVPGYEARVVGADGREVADGEVGTLHVRGESAAIGYFQDGEKSRATFHGDTVVSGDLFRRDAQGRFWYEGRADDMLKVAGIWVAPREVEECLLDHPAVRECCVVGYEEEHGLTTALAYVAVRAGHAGCGELAQGLIDHVKSRLVHYKAPRRVEFMEALPRNDRGKIARAELRKLAEAAARPGRGAKAAQP
jgi:benzoate-CoA ligase family protein